MGEIIFTIFGIVFIEFLIIAMIACTCMILKGEWPSPRVPRLPKK